ncbi:MAG: adenylate/guanylate cyclase domain-containing protein [Verrucomicrobiota bacterium]|nr:adenylate/guanylate cyclase domain-containing protein [Verrucomicrobiota bacterium]
MTIKEIIAEAQAIFSATWNIREGRKIPDTPDLQLGNDGLTLNGAVLYADMADSTNLVDRFKPSFAAEIYKTYLLGACRIIRDNGGEITAFDGDRVMAVYVGEYKNTSAVKTALKINAYVIELNALIKRAYPTTSYVLSQSVGIDSSELLVARTGIRNSNDLVWVGRAANYAAKLSALADATFPTYITEAVFAKLDDPGKYGGQPRSLMWEKRTWTERGITVYRSAWSWKF